MTIHFLHDFRYWTDYLHPYLDEERFSLLRSHRSDSSYPAPPLDHNNPDHRQIVVAGHSDEKFAPHTRVIARIQHSPGFGAESLLQSYRWVHASSIHSKRIMLPANALSMLRNSKHLPANQMVLRDQLFANPKLLSTQYDPSLNYFYRAPKTAVRVPGSVLVSLNWRITLSPNELNPALNAMTALLKNHALRLVAHPFSKARWIGSKLHGELEAFCIKNKIPMSVDISRAEMMVEFDQAEYIVTDGSGSVYEAVARGCKALLLGDLSYQRGTQILASAAAGGYLPPTRVADIDRHPGAERDLEWLKKLHPNSIVDEDVSKKTADELFDAFAKW